MNTAVKAGNTLYLSKGKQYIHPCLGVSIVVGCSPGHFGSVCNLKVIQLLKIVFKQNKGKQRVPYRNPDFRESWLQQQQPWSNCPKSSLSWSTLIRRREREIG